MPVYNKAPTLAECLQSILAQPVRSLEVICVDDASTDGSQQILEQFAQADERVQVIRHDQNRGAGVARNTGLAAATGEFVQFTDADDIVETGALRRLLHKARVDNVEVVRGSIVGFHSTAPDELLVLDAAAEQSRIRPLDHSAFWVPWWHTAYLFSRQFLLSQGISYPDLCSGEDPVFLANVLTRVTCVSTTAQVIYRYRLRPLEAKGRASYRHLRDYLRHAERVRELFLAAQPDAWHSGFAPMIYPEIENMVTQWEMSDGERAAAVDAMNTIFEPSSASSPSHAPRKVLFVYNVCGLGGVEASIINKLEALRSLGIAPMVLFEAYWGEGGKSMASQHPDFVVETDEEARVRFLRDWSPDAVIVIDSPWFLPLISKSGLACPVLLESHMPDPDALERRVMSGVSRLPASIVIVPSEFNRTVLAQHGVDPARIRVIRNGIDGNRFRPDLESDVTERLGLPCDRRLVLFVGRLEPQKNPLEFVRVAASLTDRDPSIHWVMVGDAVETADYAAPVWAEAQALDGRVSFIQRVGYDDMPLLYGAVAQSGGCLLSTSVHESQPMIVLEAMACGCPVVASDVGGLREIVDDGKTGQLYAPGDVAAAANAVLRLLNEAEHRKALVSAAHHFVQQNHTPARAAAAYLALLDEVAPLPKPDAASKLAASKQAARDHAARLDELIGEFIALHTDLLASTATADSLEAILTRLFAEPMIDSARRSVEPYRNLVPQIQLGFEPTATVEMEIHPKEDFSRSPDKCRNTLVIDYRGPSRWLTLEVVLTWEDLQQVEQYQIGLYARPNRLLSCAVALRLPQGDGDHKDVPCCQLALSPETRSSHGRGQITLPSEVATSQVRQPRLMFFFDAGADLHLELDYLTVYFA